MRRHDSHGRGVQRDEQRGRYAKPPSTIAGQPREEERVEGDETRQKEDHADPARVQAKVSPFDPTNRAEKEKEAGGKPNQRPPHTPVAKRVQTGRGRRHERELNHLRSALESEGQEARPVRLQTSAPRVDGPSSRNETPMPSHGYHHGRFGNEGATHSMRWRWKGASDPAHALPQQLPAEDICDGDEESRGESQPQGAEGP